MSVAVNFLQSASVGCSLVALALALRANRLANRAIRIASRSVRGWDLAKASGPVTFPAYLFNPRDIKAGAGAVVADGYSHRDAEEEINAGEAVRLVPERTRSTSLADAFATTLNEIQEVAAGSPQSTDVPTDLPSPAGSCPKDRGTDEAA